MDFADFVKKHYGEEHDSVPRSALQRLGRVLERTGDIQTLLSNNDPALDPFPPSTLAELSDAHTEYLHWKESAKDLRRNLAKNNLTLPDGIREFAPSAHQLRALDRIAELCQRSGHPDHDNWALAVRAHLDLWNACVSLSLEHGSVVVELDDSEHPDAAEFESLTTSRAIISEIKGYKWLAIRRGQRSGILKITLELPWNDIERQAESRLPDLGLVAEKRGIDSLIIELVQIDLEKTVLELIDTQAARQAFASARAAYLGLLSTPPLQVDRLISIFVGKKDAPAGVAIIDKKCDVIENTSVSGDADLEAKLAEIIESAEPSAAIVPISSDDSERLRRAEAAVEDLPLYRIHTAAIAEARKNLPYDREIANAVILGRRALKPGREWGRVDPLSLGLGEYPREVDQEQLREILLQAKTLSSWERRKRKPSGKKGSGNKRQAAPVPTGKRLNTFLKTIRDLKPGMMVDGVVTNLTRFGAFVNVGLPTEGMIHVSQLSAEFVDDPSQVVRVGQAVKARVLEVVPEKDRIALSLKPALTDEASRPGESRNGQEGPKTKRGPPKTRSAALADLDALFKK